MSFAFNFDLPNSTCLELDTRHGDMQQVLESDEQHVHHTRIGEHFLWQKPADWYEHEFTSVKINTSTTSIHFHIVNTSTPQFIKRTGSISSILTASDLQTGIYEGGFKLWECALDLIQYMSEQLDMASFAGLRVAELGCGHGLPGIYALQRGADHCVFMDYNKEVLELTTCPNVLYNSSKLYDKTSYYAGAWSSVSHFMEYTEQLPAENQLFDLILTAETIYTEAVAVELFKTIKQHLRPVRHAIALVAAKKYYFGTGGSVEHFLSLVKRDDALYAEIVWQESDGRSNIRAIIRVRNK